jgi:hypothetical protein
MSPSARIASTFRLILILGVRARSSFSHFQSLSQLKMRECGIHGSLLSTSRPFSGRPVIKFFRVARSFDRSLERRN